jgi:clan AA aspartic protease
MRITQSFKSYDFVRFPITLSAPGKGRHKEITYSGRIDTGFNGFLSIPQSVANFIGLKASHFVPVTLANGEVEDVPASLCRLKISGKGKEEDTLIYPKGDILIGMEFLELFEIKLIVDPVSHTAILTDENIHL